MWTWAGLVGLAVVATGPAGADEPMAAPKGATQVPLVLPAEANGHAGDAHVLPPAEHANESEYGMFSGLFFTGEYLLIRPRRSEADDFAIISSNRSVLPGGTVLTNDWGTNSGFRVGAGYQLPGDGWSLGMTYTYFHSEHERFFGVPPGGALLATLTAGGGNDDVGTANPQTNIDYNVIDLEASKSTSIGESFCLRFFGGGRLAFIDQQFSCIYNGGTLGNNPVFVNSPVYFRGAGLTGGAEGTWKVYHSWGVYGRARLSLLSGQFTTSLGESLNGGATQIVNVTQRYEAVVPVMDLGAGICFQGKHFRFSLGYDLSNWFNMVDSIDFPSGASLGHIGRRTSDLTLEGLSAQMGVIF
jgi:hypothetical protein